MPVELPAQRTQLTSSFPEHAHHEPNRVEASRSRALEWAVLSAAVSIGLFLRLFHLDYQSVWYDEIFSIAVTRLPLKEMMGELVRDIAHPPLHYLLWYVWLRLFPADPLHARLLSVLFGTGSIIVLYFFAKRLFDRQTAFFSALLLAVSQVAVMESQEARMYALLMFLILSCALTLLIALERNSPLLWWVFVLFAVLALYTHYYAIFALTWFFLFVFLSRERYGVSVVRLITSVALIFLLFLPWMMSGVIGQAVLSPKTSVAMDVKVHWWTPISVFNTFSNGKVAGLLSNSPWWSFPMGGLLFVLPLLLAVCQLFVNPREGSSIARKRKEHLLFTLGLLLVPLAFVLGIGRLTAHYQLRYATFCVAPFVVLVAYGIATLKPTLLSRGLLFAAFAFSLFGLRANYSIPYKEDYRGALSYLAQHYGNGDYLVAAPPWEARQIRLAWTIYHPAGPNLHFISSNSADFSQAARARIWVVCVIFKGSPGDAANCRQTEQAILRTHLDSGKEHYFWIDVDSYRPRAVATNP